MVNVHWNCDFKVNIIVYEGDTDILKLKNTLSMKGFDYKVKSVSRIGYHFSITCDMKKAGKLYTLINKN